jgi:MoaA/NifB/PqqE/SkfB family radical SAM enzyme
MFKYQALSLLYMTTADNFEGLNAEQVLEAKALAKRIIPLREAQFTSTGHKLDQHPDMIRDLSNKRPHIVSAHIMPTDICNLACSFCSVADRNSPYQKTSVVHSDEYKRAPFLDMETEIIPAVQTLKKWGLQAIIFSGGGEPTFYKDKKGHNFADLVRYMKGENLEVALINNGTRLGEMPKDVYEALEWIRVSWYPFEYPGVYNKDLNIPKPGPNSTLGYSLVVTDKPHKDFHMPLEEDPLFGYYVDAVKMINEHGKKAGAEYIRLVPDCHVAGEQHLMLHRVAQALQDEIGELVLYQQKFHRPPKQCFNGYVRPVIYANGLVFPCDSLILNDSSDRRFHPKYAMTDIKNLDSYLEGSVGNLKSLISNTNSMCPKCVFYENNTLMGQYISGERGVPNPAPEPMIHKNFV